MIIPNKHSPIYERFNIYTTTAVDVIAIEYGMREINKHDSK